MSAREELAQTIASKLDRVFGRREFGPAPQDYELADALLAEGYVKLPGVTTIEELDALPVGTEIVDQYERLTLEQNPDGELEWYDEYGNTVAPDLPAIVIPEAFA